MELSSKEESLYKTITYRISVALVTFLAFLYIGSLGQATGITIISQIVGVIWYYCHERLYAKFGRDQYAKQTEIIFWKRAREEDIPS